jgi:hypothetical protein
MCERMEPRHIRGQIMNDYLKEEQLEARNFDGGINLFIRRTEQARRQKN